MSGAGRCACLVLVLAPPAVAGEAAARGANSTAAQSRPEEKDAAGPRYRDMNAGQWTQALGSQQRMEAMAALHAGDKDALPVLAELLKSDHSMVRMVAAMGLERLGAGAGSALPGLIVAVKDTNLNVRYWAISTLKKMGPSAASAVPALTVALSTHPDSEPGLEGPPRYYKDIRSVAAEALGSIGPGAKSAVLRLGELAAKDTEAEVRSAATAALALIEK